MFGQRIFEEYVASLLSGRAQDFANARLDDVLLRVDLVVHELGDARRLLKLHCLQVQGIRVHFVENGLICGQGLLNEPFVLLLLIPESLLQFDEFVVPDFYQVQVQL